MDFFTLFWLCVGAGILAGGVAACVIAWHMPAFVGAIHDLASSIRGRDYADWGGDA